MPEMISPVSMTVRSLSGRSVEFVAGEPTYVIPEIVAEAQERGAVLSGDFVQPEQPAQPPVEQPQE